MTMTHHPRARRRQLAATACAVGLLASAACGRGADEGPKTEAEDVSAGEATGALDVWAMGTEGEELGPFVKDFEAQNPDVDLTVTAVPWESAHDKIATAITSGETPDVSLIGTTWMGEFAAMDGLEPTPDGLVDPESFFPGAWESTLLDDTSYGVPWYVETRTLFYRKDLAAQAGWDEAPTSWEELTEFGQAMKAEGVDVPVYVQPGQTGAWQTALPFAWSAGASMTSDDGADYTLDTEGMREGLAYYQSLFDDGLSETGLLDPGELESGFAKGTYGAFISGPWMTQLVKDAGLAEDQLGIAVLPGQEEGMGTSFIGGGNLAVFQDSDNKDAAWKLVSWLSEPDVQADWYAAIGDLPAVQSTWDEGALAEDPLLAVFGEQLEDGQAPPTVPTWEQVAAVIDRDIEQLVNGRISLDEATADMQSQAGSIGSGL